MNLSSILALILFGVIIQFGVLGHTPNPEIFLDPHALLLVGGGTLAAFLFSNPLGRLLRIGKIFLFQVVLNRPINNIEVVTNLIRASRVARKDPKRLNGRRGEHPMLTEGFRLLAEDILTGEQLREVLHFRSQHFGKVYEADAKMMTALGKFPPAFGLLGATTGMIAMMSNLGGTAQQMVGPAMAVALVATFWGIAVANFLILPLADNILRIAAVEAITRQIILEGVLMIKRKESTIVMAEKLNGLLPADTKIERSLALWKETNSEIDIQDASDEDAA